MTERRAEMNTRRNGRTLFPALKRRIWGPAGSVVLHALALMAILNFTVMDNSPAPPRGRPSR